MIKFLLNNEPVELQRHAADQTLLDYLRSDQNLCGTKEGCASGDCGACTVVVASANEQGLQYRSINSCITFLGAVHGKQLITVEHLESKDGLHPVQQAMVDLHGSQCGFCTPGFIMSMFALYKNQSEVESRDDRIEEINQYLGGNLCRCTGYRPIQEAALASTDYVVPDQFSQNEVAVSRQLISIAQEKAPAPDPTVKFLIPDSLAALDEMVWQNPEAKLLAGGTDLALEVTQQLKSIEKIILLENVSEVSQIIQQPGQVEIGAGVSLTDCLSLFQRSYPGISQLLLRFGSTQVRNQGTIGGNVANASPIGDLPPVLLALGAELRLQKAGKERVLPIEEFFLDYRQTALEPGEFITGIIVPNPQIDQIFKVYKISKRLDDDISAVCMAVQITLSSHSGKKLVVESCRIAFGGMAAIPKRADNCERVLTGSLLDQSSIDKAVLALSNDFAPISDARASAEYRVRVAGNLFQRLLLEITSPDIATRVEHVA